MPAFGLPNYAQGIVPLTAVGATGPVAYTAKPNDVVVWTGASGASGATGPACTVTLPNITTLLPEVAVQPPVGASGPFTPESYNADDVKVIVRSATAATGVIAGVTVVTADGTTIDGVGGTTGVAVTAAHTGYTFVSKGGEWYVVGN